MPTINLNDMVTVDLNNLGTKIVTDYFQSLGVPIPSKWSRSTIELPLWELANIFGPYLYNGNQIPFKSTNIELRKMV